jgi:hypothetical protein
MRCHVGKWARRVDEVTREASRASNAGLGAEDERRAFLARDAGVIGDRVHQTRQRILNESPYLAQQVSTFYGRHPSLGNPKVTDLLVGYRGEQ